MRIYYLFILLLICGCATKSTSDDILLTAFPELFTDEYGPIYPDVQFTAGPWFSPKSEYAYLVVDDSAVMAYLQGDEIVSFIIEPGCEGFEEAKENIKTAIIETIQMMNNPLDLSSVSIITDGKSFELHFNEYNPTFTDYVLSGGLSAYRQTGWIQAAYELGEVIESCG